MGEGDFGERGAERLLSGSMLPVWLICRKGIGPQLSRVDLVAA